AAHTRASDIPNDTPKIEAARLGASSRSPEHPERTQQLPAEATAHEPGNGIAERAETLLLHRAPRHVAANDSTDQADDPTHDPAHSSSFPCAFMMHIPTCIHQVSPSRGRR